ncbi:MAG: cobyrinate a,c-diamide synthase [Ruminococcaceae bacterium]|jgi:cobyrinic acid a,c-diamide synthase|nr:cobyrinate a,c-diamide synthase [Oscillospiraceae bacterium]
MTRTLPRLLVTGTNSGCGKTTAVCAILGLLMRRGIRVTASKCGPDYIDPMFHESVLGIPTGNLDPFFCSPDLLRCLLAETGGELSVIEGAMGYYDGTGPDGTDNSAWTVAQATRTPAVLVVNGKGASASLVAMAEGFLRFKPDSGIRGVLFSGVTPMTYATLKKLTQARFGDSLIPLGFIPKLPEDCQLASRHLGLVTAPEIADLRQLLDRIADLSRDTVDLDALIRLANEAEPLDCEVPEIPALPPVKIAVARDSAFCFYYRDTLRLFEKMGAELLPFSPLADEAVPPEADGLLLGGGYPELYAERIEENVRFRESVRRAVEGGLPTIAECGGFQVLGQSLEGCAMCGVLPHDSANTGKLVRFGYVTLTALEGGLLGASGTTLRAHEFHYYDSTENGSSFSAVKPNGRSWTCGVHTDTLYAGYPHLFLRAEPDAAESFVRACLAYHAHQRKENMT